MLNLSGEKQGSDEIVAVKNFRAFHGKTDYTDESVTAEISEAPYIVYALVSIMSSSFVYGESNYWMMKQTALTFGKNHRATIYLCADTLQENTKGVMFGAGDIKSKEPGQKDPIEKARDKWQEKHGASEVKLQEEGVILKQKIVWWEQLLASPKYTQIRNFVTAIIDKKSPSVSDFEKYFSSPRHHDALINLQQKLQDVDIASQISKVIQVFIDHNDRKIKKDDFTKKGAMGIATRKYLSEEFSVFLLLACLEAAEHDRVLQQSDMASEDRFVKPLLSYPVSASPDGQAELTFSVFLEIQKLYQEFASQLDLPPIVSPLTIVDSTIPLTHQPEKKAAQKKSPTHALVASPSRKNSPKNALENAKPRASTEPNLGRKNFSSPKLLRARSCDSSDAAPATQRLRDLLSPLNTAHEGKTNNSSPASTRSASPFSRHGVFTDNKELATIEADLNSFVAIVLETLADSSVLDVESTTVKTSTVIFEIAIGKISSSPQEKLSSDNASETLQQSTDKEDAAVHRVIKRSAKLAMRNVEGTCTFAYKGRRIIIAAKPVPILGLIKN